VERSAFRKTTYDRGSQCIRLEVAENKASSPNRVKSRVKVRISGSTWISRGSSFQSWLQQMKVSTISRRRRLFVGLKVEPLRRYACSFVRPLCNRLVVSSMCHRCDTVKPASLRQIGNFLQLRIQCEDFNQSREGAIQEFLFDPADLIIYPSAKQLRTSVTPHAQSE
jgi:hypothetical protein